MQPIHVIGGGLAGSEAAWQIASRGVPVVLHEMRPARATAVHKTDGFAELVCSNSFRSDDREHNAVGLLHEEMRRLGSLVMRAADANQVPAGGALAVDRDGFSQAVTTALADHPLVEISRGEIAGLPPAEWDSVVVATGPLTSPALADAIAALTGEAALAFFDAIAPIVHRDSIDMDVAWFQSRYDAAGPGGSGADYINCPLDRGQYDAFLDALLAGDRVSFHDWEKAPYFDGCLPIEVMAERGRDTLRWGPMKPVGLTNPHQPHEKPHAVVQLRQDNRLGTLFNIVGFQTKLKHAEQVRVFRMIPGLERAEFARLGGLHRNTFLNSPKLLDGTLAARRDAASALRRPDHRLRRLCRVRRDRPAGRAASRRPSGTARPSSVPPPTTAHGALLAHITGGHIETIDAGPRSFQPMNVNFGLFPPLAQSPSRSADGTRLRGTEKTLAKRRALTARALADLDRLEPRPADGSRRRPRSGRGRTAGRSRDAAASPRIIGADFGSRADMKEPGRPQDFAGRWQTAVVLKRDVFSTVERGTFHGDAGEVAGVLRRLDEVPWWSRPLAVHLFNRERRALAAANRLGIAPPLLYDDDERLVRGYIPGSALKIARPFGDLAYFRRARAALRAVHRLSITHNDLAKEQNWLRSPDGHAYLLDFQLASTFRRRNRLFRILAYEDLRHFLKHKRRYVPDALTAMEKRVLARKSLPTRIWMATGKKVYMLVTRGLSRLHRCRRRRHAHGQGRPGDRCCAPQASRRARRRHARFSRSHERRRPLCVRRGGRRRNGRGAAHRAARRRSARTSSPNSSRSSKRCRGAPTAPCGRTFCGSSAPTRST